MKSPKIYILLMVITKNTSLRRFTYVPAVVFPAVWAWVDELSKIAIEGRHFSVLDSMLNMLGVAIGALLFYLVAR